MSRGCLSALERDSPTSYKGEGSLVGLIARPTLTLVFAD